MFYKLMGFSALAFFLTACDQPQTKSETTAELPAAQTEAPVSPSDLPKADPASVNAIWVGSELLPGTLVSAEALDDTAILIRTGEGEDDSRGTTTGAYVLYNLPETADLSGLTLKVTADVKSASGEKSPFSVAYSTNRKGNSGWKQFEAGEEFASYSFGYVIPSAIDKNFDVIGISVPQDHSVVVRNISLSVAE